MAGHLNLEKQQPQPLVELGLALLLQWVQV
jgi:hypothetical protein